MENQDKKIVKGRFMMTCRKLVIEQKKTLLVMTGGFLGLCAILGISSGLLGGVPQIGTFVMYCTLAAIGCALVASKMFFDMVTKEGRTSLFMSPATAADKFIPRLIAVVPGMLILVVLGYLVYGYTDLLVFGLKYDAWLNLYNPFVNWTRGDTLILSSNLAVFLLCESIFIFGSVAWPKKSFLKTICLIAAIQIVFSLLVWGVVKSCIAWGIDFIITDTEAFGWSVISIITCIAIAITYAAFAKFKRSTVA